MQMTVRKKLYLSFGSISIVLILLFLINTAVVVRERGASREVSRALESAQDVEAVQLKLMQNRLYLENYLLTGDMRQQEKLTQGISELEELLRKARTNSTASDSQDVLARIKANEQNWKESFANPLVA